MSNTAEALENITDVGDFEILALRVLRATEEDCRAILHLGINVQGKPIRGSLDAFGRVPGSIPAKYVAAAFTTTNLDKLESKWLRTRGPAQKKGARLAKKKPGKKATRITKQPDIGDLAKAAQSADAIRSKDFNARFVVYLCTNRRLDEELMRKVWPVADAFLIEVRFLDLTQLRDFLDTKPEGQWLRSEHLGIAVEQLSASLLRSASETSVRRFSDSFPRFLDRAIITGQTASTLSALNDRTISLHLLVGPSGIGKSVISLQTQKRAIETGCFAFWIPGEVVERSIFLSDALDIVLRHMYPTLAAGAGARALQLATEGASLVLIVDDINRVSSPSNALEKLFRWARPHYENGQPTLPAQAFKIVCPVWNSNSALLHIESSGNSWVRLQSIESFARSESITYLTSTIHNKPELHESEYEKIADRLKDDPILLAMFVDTLRHKGFSQPYSIAENILGSWTHAVIAELSEKTHVPVTEYFNAVERLASEMVSRKELYPAISELPSWFTNGPHNVLLLLQLAESGHICRITQEQQGQRSTFEFRHDRILEFFLAGALETALNGQSTTSSAVWDPYFIVFLGRAIGRSLHSDSVLDTVMAHSPVALIAALAHLSESKPGFATAVRNRAHSLLADKSVPSHIRQYAVRLLRDMTGIDVLDVTHGIAENPVLLEARLRSGDVNAGIRVLATDFWPGARATWLESIIGQAKTRHGPRMVADLRNVLRLQDLSDELRFGAFVLAGYIGECSLMPALSESWKFTVDRKRLAQPALWAIFRCCDTQSMALIEDVIPALLEIDHDPTGKTWSHRHTITQELGWASRHAFTPATFITLLDLANREEYRNIIVCIFSEVPESSAARFVVRQAAQWDQNAKAKGGISPFAASWDSDWRRWRMEGRIPKSCVDALRELWRDANEPEWVRQYALRIWYAANGDLTLLRSISRKDILYESALWFRLLAYDREITHDVLPIMRQKRFWLHYLARIWSEDLIPFLDEQFRFHLAAKPEDVWSNDDYAFAHILRDIPRATAEGFLVRHWHLIKNRPLFVQAALYVSTERTRGLAAGVHQQDPQTFKHINAFFGFHTEGLGDRLASDHLESLRPYLQHLSGMTIYEMITHCGQHSQLAWAREHLLPEYARRRKELSGGDPNLAIIERAVLDWMPSKEDRFAMLDKIGADPIQSLFHLERLSESFVRRGESLGQFCGTIRQWFDLRKSSERLRILASAIKYWGKRLDLPMLRSAYGEVEDRVSPDFSDVEFEVKRRTLS